MKEKSFFFFFDLVIWWWWWWCLNSSLSHGSMDSCGGKFTLDVSCTGMIRQVIYTFKDLWSEMRNTIVHSVKKTMVTWYMAQSGRTNRGMAVVLHLLFNIKLLNIIVWEGVKKKFEKGFELPSVAFVLFFSHLIMHDTMKASQEQHCTMKVYISSFDRFQFLLALLDGCLFCIFFFF